MKKSFYSNGKMTFLAFIMGCSAAVAFPLESNESDHLANPGLNSPGLSSINSDSCNVTIKSSGDLVSNPWGVSLWTEGAEGMTWENTVTGETFYGTSIWVTNPGIYKVYARGYSNQSATCTATFNLNYDEPDEEGCKISDKTAFINQLNTSSSVDLGICDLGSSTGIVTSRTTSNGLLHVYGSVDGVSESLFFFTVENGNVEGKVITDSTAAYHYHTEGAEVLIEEIDINKVLCINFGEAPESDSDIPVIVEVPEVSECGAQENVPVFELESYPSATAVVYLDFNGEVVSNTYWNTMINGGLDINALPSARTEAEIRFIWEIISEDFSPFNVNITTNEDVFNAAAPGERMRVIFTPTWQWYRRVGGVAFLGSFSWTAPTPEAPCWVFDQTAAADAEAASHEIGHTFALSHDGFNTLNYYTGHADWAPIMGVGYYRELVHWSQGEYNGATNTEDDVAIITNVVGLRPDDHGNTPAEATEFIITGCEEICPLDNNGVIESRTDLDVFSFTTDGGNVVLNFSTPSPSTDIDLNVNLLDAGGVVLATSNVVPGYTASINELLTAGTYYIEVDGIGARDPQTDGYSDYASLGQYEISGYIEGQTILACDPCQDGNGYQIVHKIKADGDDEYKFGLDMAAIGDLDGDNITDFVVVSKNDMPEVQFMNADGTVKSSVLLDYTGLLNNASGFVINAASVAYLGDIDGAGGGVAAIAVGHPGDDDGIDLNGIYPHRDRDRGAVVIISLNADGSIASSQKISATQGGFTGNLDASIYDPYEIQTNFSVGNNDNFGESIAWLGDLDGAGPSVAAIAVGAPGDDDETPAPQPPFFRDPSWMLYRNTGAIWILFLNADGTVSSHNKVNDAALNGSLNARDWFGREVESLGDIDGPGGAANYIIAGLPYDPPVRIIGLDEGGNVLSVKELDISHADFAGKLNPYSLNFSNFGDLNGGSNGPVVLSISNGSQVFLTQLDANADVISATEVSPEVYPALDPAYNIFGVSTAFLGDLEGDGTIEFAVASTSSSSGSPVDEVNIVSSCSPVILPNAGSNLRSVATSDLKDFRSSDMSGSVILFPTVVTQGFTLQNVEDGSSIKVFNSANSKLVFEKNIAEGDYVNMENNSSGLYIIHIVSPSGVTVKKVVKNY